MRAGRRAGGSRRRGSCARRCAGGCTRQAQQVSVVALAHRGCADDRQDALQQGFGTGGAAWRAMKPCTPQLKLQAVQSSICSWANTVLLLLLEQVVKDPPVEDHVDTSVVQHLLHVLTHALVLCTQQACPGQCAAWPRSVLLCWVLICQLACERSTPEATHMQTRTSGMLRACQTLTHVVGGVAGVPGCVPCGNQPGGGRPVEPARQQLV